MTLIIAASILATTVSLPDSHSSLADMTDTKNELPIRLAFFWVSNYLTSIVSGFLAAGFLSIKIGEYHGWQWMFLLEGLLT